MPRNSSYDGEDIAPSPRRSRSDRPTNPSAALSNETSANRSHSTLAATHLGFGGRSGVGGGSNGISLPESVGTFGLSRSSAASDGSCSVG